MAPRQLVLIVEDDRDLRGMFRTALSVAGYDTAEASDGYDALRAIDRRLPAAVVLDLGLPHLSGHDVLADLMAQAHTRDIPVIIVTGKQSAEQPKGAACLLRKPVAPDL